MASEVRVVRRFGSQAALIAGIRHPKLVPVLDVVASGDEVSVVVERPSGESFAELLRRCPEHRAPADVVVAVVGGTLAGLEMLHLATNAHGVALGFVHRGVSPEHVIVGVDGLARLHLPADASPPAYCAPELVGAGPVDRRADVYAAAVMAFEALTGRPPQPRVVAAVAERARGQSWLSRGVLFLLVGGLLVGAAWYLISTTQRDVSRSFAPSPAKR